MTDQLSAATDEIRRELMRVDKAIAGSSLGHDAPNPLQMHLARMKAARVITSHHPTPVKPGLLARPKRLIKKLGEATTRSMVELVATDARHFADAATDTVALLADMETEHQARLEREIAGLKDRLIRLERERAQPRGAALHETATKANASPQSAPLDYFAFEGVMRGPRDEIRAKQEQYVTEFATVDDILDIGCGRGEFLEILRKEGKRASGIDLDDDMVAHCVAEGLDVQLAEAVQHLSGLQEQSLGGIFAAQVVEHMKPPVLVAFLESARKALRPGGVIALETINPGSLSALKNYFADLTHAQPLVPETLVFLVEQAGFTSVRMELRSPVADEARLAHVPFAGSVPEPAQAASDRNVDIINALLFAPQDYAVIARA